MAATSLNEIYKMLGELQATAKATDSKVDGIRRDMDVSEEKSDVSRANTHRRMDELVHRTGSLEADMGKVKSDMTDVKAVTEDVKRMKLVGLGALGVTGIAAGSIASLVTAYWNKIVAAVAG